MLWLDQSLGFVCDDRGQLMQSRFRELRSSAAVIAGIRIDIAQAVRIQVAADSSDGALAGDFFAITQDLAHERPEHDRGGVGASEESVVFGENPSDQLLAQDVDKRQSWRYEKPGDSLPKSEVATCGGIGTKCNEKTLPGLTVLAGSDQGGLQKCGCNRHPAGLGWGAGKSG